MKALLAPSAQFSSDDNPSKMDTQKTATAYLDKRSRFSFTNCVEMLKVLIGTSECPTPIGSSKPAVFFLVSSAFHLIRAVYIFERVVETAQGVTSEEAEAGIISL